MHKARLVTDLLTATFLTVCGHRTFPNCSMSTNGTIKNPPSPRDLRFISSKDFFKGYFNESVYRDHWERAANIDELGREIVDLCANITPNQFSEKRVSLFHRYGYYLSRQGFVLFISFRNSTCC